MHDFGITGIIAFASSLDQAGALGISAEDIALVMEAMSGFDAKDSTSSPDAVPAYSAELENSIAGKTIGVPAEYFDSVNSH